MSNEELIDFNEQPKDDLSWVDQVEEPEPEKTVPEKTVKMAPPEKNTEVKFTGFCRSEYGMTVKEFVAARLVLCYEDTLRYLLRVEHGDRVPYKNRKIGSHQSNALVAAGVLSKSYRAGKAWVDEERMNHYLALPCNRGLYNPDRGERDEC